MALHQGSLFSPGSLSPVSPSRDTPAIYGSRTSSGGSRLHSDRQTTLETSVSRGANDEFRKVHYASMQMDKVAELQAIISFQGRQLESLERQVTLLCTSVEADADASLRSFILDQCQKLEVSLDGRIQAALGGMRAAKALVAVPESNGGMHSPPSQKQEVGIEAIIGQPSPSQADKPAFVESHYADEDGCGINAANTTKKGSMPEAVWELGQMDRAESEHSWLKRAVNRTLSPEPGIMHNFLVNTCQLHSVIPSRRPENEIVRFVDSLLFHWMTWAVVILNTIFSGFCADRSVRNLLQDPTWKSPRWWDAAEIVFLIYFSIEMVLRLAAFRMWFFMDPGVWRWNVLDLLLVLISLLTQSSTAAFLRLFRFMRLMRAVKMILQSNALNSLRNLLFAVAACIVPLFWAVVFVFGTMVFFSVFILQVLAEELDGDLDPAIVAYSEESFLGFDSCIKTLLVVVCGPDWLPPHEALSQIGVLSSLIMPIFVVFTDVGVMNIVIGVFADASASTKDRTTLAAEKIREVEDFAENMVDLLTDVSPEHTDMRWETFREYFRQESVQAYLAHHGLDLSHVALIFSLIDDDQSGIVNVPEFILGMLKFKGEAKVLGQRVTLRSLKYVMDLMGDNHNKIHSMLHRALSSAS